MSNNIKIYDLIPDNRNANKHSEYGTAQLERGIRKNGLGRSILISNDDVIIAGNGVTETAGQIGVENVRIIETDGTEIIAVKRTDIKSGTKEFYEMALSDNIIAKNNIVMDAEVTNAICEEYDIKEYVIEEKENRNIIGNNYEAERNINNGNYIFVELSDYHLEKLQEYMNKNDIKDKQEAILKLIEKI